MRQATREQPNDASAALGVEDASPADAEPPLSPAPPLVIPSMGNTAAEPEQTLLLVDSFRMELPMREDGCVRVVFAAGGPIVASLGASVVRAEVGALGARGPVCERAGHGLTLSFVGRANVRFQVFRAR